MKGVLAVQWNRVALVSVIIGIWATSAWSALLTVENPSFESPQVDPTAFQALPFVDQWIETDNDADYSSNTGVFPNPDPNAMGHLAHADANQLAFLGSEQGNGLAQILSAQYQPGYAYSLTVGMGISGLFPPSELNGLDLVFFYVDGNEPVDIGVQSVPVTGMSSSELVDVSLTLPVVQADHAWAGQAVGIAIRATGPAAGFWDLDHVRVEEWVSIGLEIKNASFETPVVDPSAFQALPYADHWVEKDNDVAYGSNTGVFPNPDPGNPGHLAHADGLQLAFLGSEQGNGFEQTLDSVYRPGYAYQLTVGVGVSGLFAPSAENALAFVLYYIDSNEPVDVATHTVASPGYTSTHLQDVTLMVGPLDPNDVCIGRSIGVAIRSVGPASGFWDLDNVRLNELLPSLPAIKNPSFEGPAVDPNAFPVVPFVAQWVELDLDAQGSTNTGVFLNSPVGADDRVVNAEGLQLAYLGSEQGNALEQELAVTYEAGSSYRLTVGVGVSGQLPPSSENSLELVMYYHDGNEPVTVASSSVPAEGLSSTDLQNVSVYLPLIQPDEAYVGVPIQLALRSLGPASGFWDLDDVRLGVTSSKVDRKE